MFRAAVLAIVLVLAGGRNPAAQDFFSADDIRTMSPRADPALVQAVVDDQAILAAADSDTRLRIAHFLSQVMTETGGRPRLDETMNYSAARLTQVFSRRVVTSAQDDQRVAHDLAGTAAETTKAIALDLDEGTGEIEAMTLDIEEVAALADAGGTYSVQKTAERRYVGVDFIPVTVIGEDKREAVLDTTRFPARAIVQILLRKREGLGEYLCTGAMVVPDIVLTAAQCVHGGTTMGLWYTDFDVFAGRNMRSKPFGACKATRLYALRAGTSAVFASDARLYNLGAIRPDCDVGNRTGWRGVAALPDAAVGQPSTVQGYAADKDPPGRQWLSLDRFRVIQSEKPSTRTTPWAARADRRCSQGPTIDGPPACTRTACTGRAHGPASEPAAGSLRRALQPSQAGFRGNNRCAFFFSSVRRPCRRSCFLARSRRPQTLRIRRSCRSSAPGRTGSRAGEPGSSYRPTALC